MHPLKIGDKVILVKKYPLKTVEVPCKIIRHTPKGYIVEINTAIGKIAKKVIYSAIKL